MSPASSSTNARHCSHCGAVLAASAVSCWLCNADVDSGSHVTGAQNTQRQPALAGQLGSFSLSTLMLFVTLVAIVCGVFSIAPGAGIVLALVMLPVLTHTAILAHREEELGHALRPGEKIMLFVGSICLVVVAGVAAAIAFGITCFAGFWAGTAAGYASSSTAEHSELAWGIPTGIALGSIAAAYVGYRVLVLISRRRGQGLSLRSKLILAGAVFLAALGALIWFLIEEGELF